MTLALVRHGRTAWNLAQRMQGRTDIALDDHGRAQARAAGVLLAGAPWDRVVTSPLVRAQETAQLIAREIGDVELECDERLVERGYGEAEGLLVSEVTERWPDADYPDAESLSALTARAKGALKELEQREENLIVVAHGTFLRTGIAAVTGAPCPRIHNGQVLLLERDGDGALRARFLAA